MGRLCSRILHEPIHEQINRPDQIIQHRLMQVDIVHLVTCCSLHAENNSRVRRSHSLNGERLIKLGEALKERGEEVDRVLSVV